MAFIHSYMCVRKIACRVGSVASVWNDKGVGGGGVGGDDNGGGGK